MLKVVAFNGSARKKGNTSILIKKVLDKLEQEDIKTELIELAGQKINGCQACYKCFQKKNKRCSLKKDHVNEYIKKMLDADGIILGSPTYFADVSATMKALIERCGMVARANGDMFRRKVGAGVVAMRRAGATNVFNSINYFFFIGQMVVPGSSYWNLAIGKDPGDVKDDAEGMKTMEDLGENFAWALKKLNA